MPGTSSRTFDAESLLLSLMENVPGAIYAGATRATVRVRLDGDAVEVEIEDDGCGGADRARGSGLRGLEDRLGTVGGVLEVASPPGHGTRLRARVPLR
jgi:signal transduction histidine kinase